MDLVSMTACYGSMTKNAWPVEGMDRSLSEKISRTKSEHS